MQEERFARKPVPRFSIEHKYVRRSACETFPGETAHAVNDCSGCDSRHGSQHGVRRAPHSPETRIGKRQSRKSQWN
jgi:hypothetical protein